MAASACMLGPLRIGGATSVTYVADSLNGAFTYESSGPAVFLHFVALESQSSAALTLYVYCDSVVGTPSDVRCALYNGAGTTGDEERPEAGGTAVVTSGATSFAGAGGTWVAFSLTGVTLVENTDYFLIIDNRTATPTSHYPLITRKGGHSTGASTINRWWGGGVTTDGFTTDPTTSTGPSPMVMKYASGLIVGNPYVTNDTPTVASHTHHGLRFTPNEDIVLRGLACPGSSAAYQTTGIWTSAGVSVRENAVETNWKNVNFPLIDMFSPVTLTGGTTYDIMLVRTATTTLAVSTYMGSASPPVDVSAAGWGTLVYGSTPGSFTEDANRCIAMELLFRDNPAIAGGGLLVHPGLAGGMRG